MTADVLEPLVAPHSTGRRFVGERRVRLGDVTPAGRLRLDALARYAQDVSDDDTADAGLAPEPAWVVRRTVIDVVEPAVLGESLVITTFCSGLGRRWAERRLRVCGREGGRYEMATLWICIDATTGRPRSLTREFLDIYGPAADGRAVTARLANPKPPPDPAPMAWPLRAVDFDTFGHVNNAAYWAVVEEALAESDQPPPFRASLEYAAGLESTDRVTIASAAVGGSRVLWWLTEAGAGPAASASLQPLPSDLYRS